jgi:hypothetical protein
VKDPFAILGVSCSATLDEVRSAYRKRAREIHPDRLDRASKPIEWARANEMLRELNVAYKLVRAARRGGAPHGPTGPEADSGAFASILDSVVEGQAWWSDLPERVQSRFASTQRGNADQHFAVPMGNAGWSLVGVTVPLCWLVLCFGTVGETRWSWGARSVIAVLTTASGYLGATSFIAFVRWSNSELVPWFYSTPLYFVETRFNRVTYWPLWKLSEVSVVHHVVNFRYSHSIIKLVLDGRSIQLKVPTKEHVELFNRQLQSFNTRLGQAVERHDLSYFADFNYFTRAQRSVRDRHDVVPRSYKLVVWGAALIICVAAIQQLFSRNDSARKPLDPFRSESAEPPVPRGR